MWQVVLCVAIAAILWFAQVLAQLRHKAKTVQSDLEGLRAEKLNDEHTRSLVSREYWSIPSETRQRLRLLAEEHIQRTHVPTMAGSIEVAVVNMWKRSQEEQRRRGVIPDGN